MTLLGVSLPGTLAGLATAGVTALWAARRRRRMLQELGSWIDGLAETGRGVRPEDLEDGLDRQVAAPVTRLLRRLRRAERQGLAARRLLEGLIDTFPDPVLLADSGREVVRCNAAAREALGIAAVPLPLDVVIRDPGLTAALDAAVREGRQTQVDVSPPADSRRRFSASVSPVETEAADRVAILVLREVSEQVMIERLRSDFIANASHEIRTPLTSLVGLVETLRGPARDDPEARAEFLELMAGEAARMQRLIDDLLSLSRIELAANAPPEETVDLGALLRTVVGKLSPRAEAAGVTVALAIADPLPPVTADADQMHQLVANLLDNAIKYGAAGGRIEVTLDRLDRAPAVAGPVAGRSALRLCVRDFGPGIPAEHLPRLTERFYRVDKARSREIGGTGLGLAIVKHVLRRHQGHLSIESRLGEGSRFCAWLPLPTTAG